MLHNSYVFNYSSPPPSHWGSETCEAITGYFAGVPTCNSHEVNEFLTQGVRTLPAPSHILTAGHQSNFIDIPFVTAKADSSLQPASYVANIIFILTFVFLCIASTITIDNQQDATILIYLLLISSTCFGRCFRPSSGAYHCNNSLW